MLTIERLREDREHGTSERERVEQEVALLNRTLDQTKGFREVLAMEQPRPDDPDYVDVEVMYLGSVGVDRGQLLITVA